MSHNPYYYFPAKKDGEFSIDGLTEFCECAKCKRKILVSMGLIGTIHHLGTAVTCVDCMEISEDVKKEFPDFVRRLEEWKAGKDIREWRQRVFKQGEEIPGDKLWPPEYTPIAGTITGEILVDGKAIQSFGVIADGIFYCLDKIGEPENYLLKGAYQDYKWNLEWAKPNPPSFMLKVNYEYEV